MNEIPPEACFSIEVQHPYTQHTVRRRKCATVDTKSKFTLKVHIQCQYDVKLMSPYRVKKQTCDFTKMLLYVRIPCTTRTVAVATKVRGQMP